MAPQATLVVPTPTTSALSTTAPTNTTHKTFVPVMLFIFLGLCLAYTLSYILYRIVMARRRKSNTDNPDSPDRGVSQFMNGARLTLNTSNNNNRSTTAQAQSESPDTLDEEKPLTIPRHPSLPEIPMTSPTQSSSTPYLVLMPSFTIHPNQEIDQVQLRELGSTAAQTQVPAPQPPTLAPAPTSQPFSRRIASKVKLLSEDRADAIALDPKLAPVQGPLRPLSMVLSPSRKKRTTLFGLGVKPTRGHGGDVNTELQAP